MLKRENILELLSSNLSPLAPWLNDSTVTEIMVNPGGHVYVESNGHKTYEGKLLSPTAIALALKALARTVNREAKANTESSIVDATLDDLRIAGALAPVSPDGAFITIRKHQDKNQRPTLDQLVDDWKSLTRLQAEKLIELVIHQKKNCIIAGATGSGKTTVTNALLSKIPHHERIFTIEDASELHVDVPNRVSLVTNPTDNLTARMMVKLAMRSYPDRLVLGETRGDETYDLIRAFNSGHDGSISTVHASSSEAALEALEMLYQMSLPSGASIPTEMVRRYIARSVNVVVYAERTTTVVNGKPLTSRSIKNIHLVKGVKDGQYVLEEA